MTSQLSPAAQAMVSEPEPSQARNWQDIAVMIVLALAIAVMIVFGLILWGVRAGVFEARDSTAAIEFGQDLGSCRSASYAAVVDALVEFDQAKGDLEVINTEGLTASTARTDAELIDVLQRVGPILDNVRTTNATLDERNREYSEATQRAITDPVGFVEECKHGRSD